MSGEVIDLTGLRRQREEDAAAVPAAGDVWWSEGRILDVFRVGSLGIEFRVRGDDKSHFLMRATWRDHVKAGRLRRNKAATGARETDTMFDEAYFDALEKKNKVNAERVAKERAELNKRTKRDYRIKE